MKILRQLTLIIGLFLIGDFCSNVLHFPLPGNIIGMLLLLFLLITKIVKLSMVEDVADFFLNHLAFFFIPAGVRLMNTFGLISSSIIRIMLICIFTTFLVIVTTGWSVQGVVSLNGKIKRRRDERNNI
ncbi:MAG: CidA/LrgA family protein [Spirochaetales bacterium]|nr:CidA/LrgA family protein [Spirochaetales bacterium]